MAYPDTELIRSCMNELYLARSEFTRRFYQRFFDLAPDARALFVHDQAQQEKILFAAMTMILSCLTSGRSLHGALGEFGRRHARAGVSGAFLPDFGEAFVSAMIEFLPEQDPLVVRSAWARTWRDICIPFEVGIRTGEREMETQARLFRRGQKPARRAARGTVARAAGP
jgi:hemoglobin-like flavoprotein